jgi:ABC-type multidrug transport system fused ATPase/permease subunit
MTVTSRLDFAGNLHQEGRYNERLRQQESRSTETEGGAKDDGKNEGTEIIQLVEQLASFGMTDNNNHTNENVTMNIDTTASTDSIDDGPSRPPRRSPQGQRESLLNGLINLNRQSFVDIAQAGGDTAGARSRLASADTVTSLEQIEEGGEDTESTSAVGVPSPSVPTPQDFGGTAGGRRVSSAGTFTSAGTSRRSIFIADAISGRYNEEEIERGLVQVNMKNFSYFIPEKMDKPTVPTVFNQSVFYAAFEVGRRVTKYLHWKTHESKRSTPDPSTRNDGDAGEAAGSGDGDHDADASSMSWGPTKAQDIVYPYSKRPVLKNINLVLKPGNTYLVLGPPGCGKVRPRLDNSLVLSFGSC